MLTYRDLVPTIECPAAHCFNSGAVVGRGIHALPEDGAFERRGKLGRKAVFRCSVCGEIFAASIGLLVTAVYALTIEAQGEMEGTWQWNQSAMQMAEAGLGPYATEAQREAARERRRQQEARREANVRVQNEKAGRTLPCPYCERYLKDETGLAAHLTAKHAGELAGGASRA